MGCRVIPEHIYPRLIFSTHDVTVFETGSLEMWLKFPTQNHPETKVGPQSNGWGVRIRERRESETQTDTHERRWCEVVGRDWSDVGTNQEHLEPPGAGRGEEEGSCPSLREEHGLWHLDSNFGFQNREGPKFSQFHGNLLWQPYKMNAVHFEQKKEKKHGMKIFFNVQNHLNRPPCLFSLSGALGENIF